MKIEIPKDQISLEFAISLIERLAYEAGVNASVTKSEDKMFPRLLHVVITEEANLDGKRTAPTCQSAKFIYDFDIGIGSGVLSITGTFPYQLLNARGEARDALNKKVGEELKIKGIIPT